jgi:hypothetical protein
MNERQLLFVYNADSDLFSTVVDFAHKIFSPSTYQCSLCALTYGNVSIKQEWKLYIEALPIKTLFLHKDEFLQQYKFHAALPAVFIRHGAVLETLMTKEDIDNCETLEQLKEKLSSKLAQNDQHYHTNL